MRSCSAGSRKRSLLSEQLHAKPALRRELKERCRRIPADVRRRESAKLARHLIAWLEEHETGAVALYAARQFEIDPGAVRQWARQRGVRIFYPRVNPATQSLEFLNVEAEEHLQAGAFGILEPTCERPSIEPEDFPLVVLVPGLAFDWQGHRLGSGLGYYDRALGSLRKKVSRVGVAYTFQIRASLPVDPWDQRMDLLATEQFVVRCRTGTVETGQLARGLAGRQ